MNDIFPKCFKEMSRDIRKSALGSAMKTAQLQKLAGVLKFWIQHVESISIAPSTCRQETTNLLIRLPYFAMYYTHMRIICT